MHVSAQCINSSKRVNAKSNFDALPVFLGDVINDDQMSRPEQLDSLIDEEALQRARDKRRKVDTYVSEKVSITKRMYESLDTCIKSIGKQKNKRNDVIPVCAVDGYD